MKPIVSSDSIITLAERCVSEYLHQKRFRRLEAVRIDLQEMYEMVLYPAYEYQVITSVDLGYHNGEKVLGKTIQKERTILLDPSISPPNLDPRYTFTFGHEQGHGILHARHQELYRCAPTGALETTANKGTPESQANLFSEHLVMPDGLVKCKFQLCYRPTTPFRYLGRGNYGFETFGDKMKRLIDSYTEFCEVLARPLARDFSNISITSLALKIHKLGLVQNYTSETIFEEPTLIRHILRNMTRW